MILPERYRYNDIHYQCGTIWAIWTQTTPDTQQKKLNDILTSQTYYNNTSVQHNLSGYLSLPWIGDTHIFMYKNNDLMLQQKLILHYRTSASLWCMTLKVLLGLTTFLLALNNDFRLIWLKLLLWHVEFHPIVLAMNCIVHLRLIGACQKF